MRAAEIFNVILLESRHMEMSLDYKGAPSDKELEKRVDEAVDIFLKVFGTEDE